MNKLLCHGCGGLFSRSHGAGLFCSPKCEQDRAEKKQGFAQLLKMKGFVGVDVLNTFVKDGVHITMDQVLHEGMDKTLARHADAVRSRGNVREAAASAE